MYEEKLDGRRTKLGPESGHWPWRDAPECDTPEQAYVIGDVEALEGNLVAIIGARKATPYGLRCARRFAALAAAEGWCVVTGGGVGCATAAMQAAIEAGGRTVALVGGGCVHPYPQSNAELFKRVVKAGGAVVSTSGWDTPARPGLFMVRNRHIAGIARCALLVEAGFPSGTMQIAEYVTECGKPLMAVPGNIDSPQSQGPNLMAGSGARLVACDRDFLRGLACAIEAG